MGPWQVRLGPGEHSRAPGDQSGSWRVRVVIGPSALWLSVSPAFAFLAFREQFLYLRSRLTACD